MKCLKRHVKSSFYTTQLFWFMYGCSENTLHEQTLQYFDTKYFNTDNETIGSGKELLLFSLMNQAHVNEISKNTKHRRYNFYSEKGGTERNTFFNRSAV